MDGVSLFDIVQTLVVGWIVLAQRRFNREVKEAVADAGWNWERDEMYAPANSELSDKASLG